MGAVSAQYSIQPLRISYKILLDDVPWTLACILSFLDSKNFEPLALKIADTLKIGDDTNEIRAIRIREKFNLRRFQQGVHEGM